MPLYDYECEQCHRHTEKIQKFSDAPLTECPHCGGRLERVVHAPAVAFKGGGWYADLYSSKKPGGAGANSAGESKGGEGKSDAGGAKAGESSASSSKDSAASSSSSAATPSTTSSAPASATASNSGTK